MERPVNSQRDRAAVLSALLAVDYTCIFDEDTPFDLISELLPNVLVKGGDYTPETIVGADVVRFSRWAGGGDTVCGGGNPQQVS